MSRSKEELMAIEKQDDILDITGDKKWVYQYNLEMNQQRAH